MTRPRQALLVDDVGPILESLEPTLRRLAAQIPLTWRTEGDARAALALLQAEPFDLVVADLRMPHVDGLDLLAAARRRNPQGRRALMTGYTELSVDPARLGAASPDAILLKPLRGRDLLLTLGDLLVGDPGSLDIHRAHVERLLGGG